MVQETHRLTGIPSKRSQKVDKNLHIGSWLLSQGYAAEALPWLDNSSDGFPRDLNLAICHRQLTNFSSSLRYLQLAGKRTLPGEDQWVLLEANCGMLNEDIGDFAVATEYYRRAHVARPNNPTIALNYAMCLLRNGEWEKAWPLWEFGRQPDLKLSNVPRWTGKESGEGKSLLICPEGGYGDLIWLMRYFPALKERGFTIHLWTWDSLLPLLEKHPWIDELLPASQGVNLLRRLCAQCKLREEGHPPDHPFRLAGADFELRYDYQLPLMSIPAVLGVTEPCVVPPYITAEGPCGVPPASVESLALRNKRIGICWKAEETSTARPHRSLPDEAAWRICHSRRDVTYVSLVPGESPVKGELEGFVRAAEGSDWLATARIMHSCDLIISVDTAVAHVAGAMGLPCWLLLPMRSDWRWGLPGKRFQWYANMRMFTQTDPISWQNVVKEVTEALHEL